MTFYPIKIVTRRYTTKLQKIELYEIMEGVLYFMEIKDLKKIMSSEIEFF
jgi:hypothetical protein